MTMQRPRGSGASLRTGLAGMAAGAVLGVGAIAVPASAEWFATTGWHHEARVGLWLLVLGIVLPRPIAAARAGAALLSVLLQGVVLSLSVIAAGFWLTAAQLVERDDAGFVVLGACCAWTLLARSWLADAAVAWFARLRLLRDPSGGPVLDWCRALALGAWGEGEGSVLRALRLLGIAHARIRGFRWSPGRRLVRAFESASASRLRARRRELDRSPEPSPTGQSAVASSLVAELRLAALRASLDRDHPRVFDARVRRVERALATLILGCSPRATRDDGPLCEALDAVDAWSRTAVDVHEPVSRLMAPRLGPARELVEQAHRPVSSPGPWHTLERGLIALRLLESDLPHWVLDVVVHTGKSGEPVGPVLRAVEVLAREMLADPALALAPEDHKGRVADELWCRARLGARRGVRTVWSPEPVDAAPHRPVPSVALDHGRHLPGLVFVPGVVLAVTALLWMTTWTWPGASLLPSLTEPLDARGDASPTTSVAALGGAGEVLVGTAGSGVRVVDGTDFAQRWERVAAHPGLSSDRVLELAASSQDMVVAHVEGTGHGASMRSASGDWTSLIAPVRVGDLSEESIRYAAVWSGKVVIATPEGGFLRYEPSRRALESVAVDG